MQQYRARFQPSENLEEPQTNVAFFVFCSNDPETVHRQQAMIDYRFLQYETRGKVDPFDYNDLKTIAYSPGEEARIQHNRQRMIMGNSEEVKKQLLRYADQYEVDELMLVNVASEFEERLESYRLLSEVFELKSVVA